MAGLRTSGRSIIDETSGAAGEHPSEGKVELEDVITMEMTDGTKHEYKIVAVLNEDDSDEEFAVAYCEAQDEFAVLDATGKILEDQELAQEILDDFIVLAQESAGEN